jgi:hypothetical protein
MAHAIIRGMVRYRNRVPVRGAIIILERMVNVFNEELKEEDWEGVYLGYAQTNMHGEFCFSVPDNTNTYRVKVFDNHHE